MLSSFLARNVQLFCFALIGVANTLVHGLLLVLMVEKFVVDVTIAHLFAFCLANVVSYILNSRFTFRARLAVGRYARFLLASLMSLGLTLLLSWIADVSGLHYLIGFFLIVVLVPLFSFSLMRFWIFAGGDR